ncbi:MAG: YihA family ribosome biogenesis GTP-binding protein, partial [Brevundimonas sp.]
KDVDKEALDALDLAAVSYQIVLTKADKLKKGEAEVVQAATLKAVSKRPAAYPAVAVTSAEKGLGMPELRLAIMQATGTAP